MSERDELRKSVRFIGISSGRIIFELCGVLMDIDAYDGSVKNGPKRIGAWHKFMALLSAPEAAPQMPHGRKLTAEDVRMK